MKFIVKKIFYTLYCIFCIHMVFGLKFLLSLTYVQGFVFFSEEKEVKMLYLMYEKFLLIRKPLLLMQTWDGLFVSAVFGLMIMLLNGEFERDETK